jgi:hypothetical protein
MEISYRRPPVSLQERALARLVRRRSEPAGASVRADLVRGVDVEFRQA